MLHNTKHGAVWKRLYFFAIAGLIPLAGLQDVSGDLSGHPTGAWNPDLPLNTIIFDYVNCVFLFISAIWFSISRKSVTLVVPYPLLLILTGSLVAMFNAQAATQNVISIIQDLYLILFFWGVSNLIDTPRDLRYLVLSWTAVAVSEAVLILGYFVTNPAARAYGTLEDSNGAALYLGMSLFLLLQPYVRIHGLLRSTFALLIVVATLATKSLGAMVALPISVGLAFVLYWRRVGSAKRTRLSLAVVMLAVASIAIVPQAVEMPNFIDRAAGSAVGRRAIWEAGLHSFMGNPLGIGIGPAGFAEEHMIPGGTWAEAKHKELHNDYLAYLVERGVIGFMGFVLLLGSFGVMLRQNIKAARSERGVLWVAGLSGMFCFALVDAMFHEVMHARYVWLLLALIAAENKLARSRCWVAARGSGGALSRSPLRTAPLVE
jgi:O-antigen ligase